MLRLVLVLLVIVALAANVAAASPASSAPAKARRRAAANGASAAKRRIVQQEEVDAEANVTEHEAAAVEITVTSRTSSATSRRSTSKPKKTKRRKASRTAERKAKKAPAEEPAQMDPRSEPNEDELEGEVEMTLSERGALFGSILMSPAGVPGMIVGGAFGGAAGFLTDRIDRVRAYITDAYGDRVQVEQQNEKEMAKAEAELRSLDEIRVASNDPMEAEALAAALSDFVERPCNRRCADCAVALETRNAGWASINTGVIVCKQCAACHRSLGVSVSRMKSVVFDKWEPATARAFLELGNDVGRARYLARLPRGYAEPTSETDEARRKHFIHAKYARLRWAEPSFRTVRLEEIAAAQKARTQTPSTKRPAVSSDGLRSMGSLGSEI